MFLPSTFIYLGFYSSGTRFFYIEGDGQTGLAQCIESGSPLTRLARLHRKIGLHAALRQRTEKHTNVHVLGALAA